MQFKLATKEDNAGAIADAIVDAVQDSPFNELLIDYNQLVNTVENFIDDPDKVIIILKDEDEIVGFIAALVVKNHFLLSPNSTVQELGWWVDKRYRKTRASYILLDAFAYWAKHMGANYITLGHYENETGKRLRKIYNRLGFKEVEHSYIKELN